MHFKGTKEITLSLTLHHTAPYSMTSPHCMAFQRYEGDNAIVAPKGVADRINMGLIPDCVKGWPVAAAAMRSVATLSPVSPPMNVMLS